MGMGVEAVANILSFPELFLILRRDAKRKTADFRFSAIARTLAAAAPWSTDAAKKANDFIQSLEEPKEADPQQNTGELARILAQAGIPVREE